MKYNVTIIEPSTTDAQGTKIPHPFAFCLHDWARAIAYTIRRLGRECHFTQNTFVPDCMNLVLGGHHVAGGLENVPKPYIVVQTELVDSLGHVNHMEHDGYLAFLKRADYVWNEVWAHTEHIKELTRAPVLEYSGGYVPELEEVPQNVAKDIDFLFFGSVTPKRRIILNCLADKGYSIEVVFGLANVYRNEIIARSKVHLAPCHDLPKGNTSIQRLTYLLNNKQVVLTEEGSDHMELAKCGWVASAGDYIDEAERLLKEWDKVSIQAAEGHRKFKEQYPFTNEIRRLLAECGDAF